jgi:acetyl-CoA/propionyl-CoA carboxylase biotin carboxyl carrier protein
VRKVLIAGRGESAVRIARACADAGLTSVAVYAEPDLDALHVRTSDEAYALGGRTAAESYLDAGKLLAVAAACGADAVHPGGGTLAAQAEFAQAVLDAGLVWIGPPPAALTVLGDETRTRQLAERVGAPMAIAESGGGFSGPRRHVETQCLADVHGTVVVVSTRDGSLRRGHRRLVEEAPAPFLCGAQEDLLRSASKAILRATGYIGAVTCEFLVGPDGAISFLAADPRLPGGHAVTEEVTGVDLVRETFRLADGAALAPLDPVSRGHAVGFRITAEDAGSDFRPAVGTLTGWRPPSGPGVRLDTGVDRGDTVSHEFGVLLAELVVTGATRGQALERARRALAEFAVTGLPTVLPFHRALLAEPAFAGEPSAVHTRWVATGFAPDIPPYDGETVVPTAAARETITVEVGGTRVEVGLPGGFGPAPARPLGPPPGREQGRRAGRCHPKTAAAGGDAVVAPMQGTIVEVAARDGATVAPGDLIVVLEAMKMEQPLTAHKAGTVTGLSGVVGETVAGGATICEIRD